MPFFIGGARMIGADVPCHLLEYMRTIVYQVPVLRVKEHKSAACIILNEPEFRASVVTDPFSYLRDEGISEQFDFEDNFQGALDHACPSPLQYAEPPLYLVIQFKEDLNSFAATEGQCRRIGSDGNERFLLVECGVPYTPILNERKPTINAVLTAVRGEFGITDGMKPCFNTRCYRADDGHCVLPYGGDFTATGQVTRQIDPAEVTRKAGKAAVLAAQIERSIQTSDVGTQNGHGPDFNVSLEELTEALQLDETRDHAYLRLWYLQLYDRIEKFGKQCRPRLQLRDKEGLSDEIDHRNLIAHLGVEQIDGTLLRSIQTKAIRIIKRKT